MKYILKNLRPYWKSVIMIVLLLIVQSYCSLSMPNYTAKLIDTGIQHRGIEHILPEKITKEDFIKAKIFMKKSEKEIWEKSYKEKGKFLELTDETKKELGKSEKLDNKLNIPLVLTYQFSHSKDPEFKKAIEKSGNNPEKLNELLPMIESGKIQPEVLDKIRMQMEKVVEKLGPQVIKGMGTAYAKECDERAGLDVDDIQMRYLWKAGLMILVLACIMFVVSGLSAYVSSRVGALVGRDLRNNVFRTVMSYSNSEIDKFSIASLITRNTNDVQQVQMVTPVLLRIIFYAPILGIGGIYMVANSASGMSWLIAIGVSAVAIVVGVLSAISIPKFNKMQILVDKINLVSREILTGLPVIRAFGTENEEEKRFDISNKELRNNQLFTNRVMTFMMPSMFFIMYSLVIAITWVSAHKIDDGSLQVGEMTAFITYSILIVMAFLMLAAIAVMIPRASVAAKRIDEVLKTKTSINNIENPISNKEIKGVIEFNDVSFKYPNAEDFAISDISFRVEPGKTLGIIGSTGSGKSTIVNLIPRFYDPTKGNITLDGIDIKQYDIKALRNALGIVPQKGVLFSGSIESNIKFGNENLTEENLKSVADISQATEFIELKEEDFKSSISQGGSNISGGQKQRLSIARALAKNAPVLIFDDSFSALDLKTDKALRNALYEKCSSVSKIIVAQRIHTIIDAEEILVLDEGKIVGKGSHKELMKDCLVYQQIAKYQLAK